VFRVNRSSFPKLILQIFLKMDLGDIARFQKHSRQHWRFQAKRYAAKKGTTAPSFQSATQ
jgi:hypothetical protein